MKTLVEFIQESLDRIKPTVEWMEEHYKKYNEELFNNELPKKIRLGLIKTKNVSTLGWQGFDKQYYMSGRRTKDGKYVMIQWFNKKQPQDGLDLITNGKEVTNCTELDPFIEINSKFKFSRFQLEDTMIHEMVHLWISKDGLVPKKVHGKEFKAKCEEIRNKAKKLYNIEYHLGVFARGENNKDQGFDYTEEAKEIIANQLKKKAERGGGVYSVYFIFDQNEMPKETLLDRKLSQYTNRFLFCTKNKLEVIIDTIKKKQGITHIYVSGSSYIPFVEKYGKFSTVNEPTKFWDASNYDDNLLMKDAKDVLTLNESFGSKLKELINKMMNNIFVRIDKETPSSEVNIEDLFDDIENSQEIYGDKKNDNKMIELEKN